MLVDRAALVTGGGTGIGFACAKAIVDAGGKVAIAGRRIDVLEAAVEALGERASAVQCDIADTESVQRAVTRAVDRNGPLQLAVNAAYGAMVGSFLATPADLFAMTTNSTLNGTYRSMQSEAKAMLEASGGSIVNISSVAAARSGGGRRRIRPRRPASTCSPASRRMSGATTASA